MARPKSFFPVGKAGRKEAVKASKTRSLSCHKFTRNTRDGKETGFYVGNDIPIRLASATLDKIR